MLRYCDTQKQSIWCRRQVDISPSINKATCFRTHSTQLFPFNQWHLRHKRLWFRQTLSAISKVFGIDTQIHVYTHISITDKTLNLTKYRCKYKQKNHKRKLQYPIDKFVAFFDQNVQLFNSYLVCSIRTPAIYFHVSL